MNVARGPRNGLGLLLLAALSAVACYDFHLTGPEDPPPVPVPRLVSVTVEYVQPIFCLNVTATCEGAVFFWGSWMLPRGEFALARQPGTRVWRGTAQSVPVNFPPRDQPYLTRVFDPYLTESPTGGPTAERLTVGGQFIVFIDSPGTPAEAGLVYIDDNGQGRSPF